ncbi:MAG: RagB/SusD family nutrient uptake outer membrane protein [Bacteroidales bacterium]
MKKSKYIYLIAAMIGLSACSDDFLTVKSPDKISIDEYYNSESRIFEALVAAYDPLQWPDWGMNEYNPSLIISDIMADDIWVGGSNKTDNQNWHLMANYEALPDKVVGGIWTCYYSGINRCNNVMHYMNGVKNISDAKKALFLSEAKVLRAFYYTYLWKMWGNIPCYTVNLEFPYISEQSSADEVYQTIIADLDDAIANGGLPMKATSDTYGRVTKAMAYMLYTEAVLYQKDNSRYPKALEYMTEIIQSNQYQLHPDFNEIFAAEGEWSNESIWEINYKSEGAARSWNSPLVSGGTVLSRLISPNGWTDGTDGRDNGWGFCPVRLEAFDLFDYNDIRRDATIFNTRGKSYNPRYQDTGLWLNKYMARTNYNEGQLADADLNWSNNLRIYRYAETLLNAAELIKRGAGAGNADEYLNMVRERAGVGNSSATLENILHERHLEFMGEGKRYWDLIRFDAAASVLTPDSYNYRTNTWSPNKKWLPIPQSEINASQGKLTQNNY